MIDPNWVNAAGTLIGGLAVAIGLLQANRQLNSWRLESLHKKSAEIAEELLVSVHQVSETLKSLRHPLLRVPEDEIVNGRTENWQFKRIAQRDDEFRQLRLRQIRARAFFDSKELDEAVDELFRVKHLMMVSLEMLADGSLEKSRETSDRALLQKLRRDLAGTYGDNDPLGRDQEKAVATIGRLLTPRIRMGMKIVP